MAQSRVVYVFCIYLWSHEYGLVGSGGGWAVEGVDVEVSGAAGVLLVYTHCVTPPGIQVYRYMYLMWLGKDCTLRLFS